jgi:hypothetical protein
MKLIIIGIICLLAIIVIFILKTRNTKWPVSNVCSVCGAKSQGDSQYGYSQHAEEDPGKMKPLCRKCLISQLDRDYTNYLGHALVIQPAVGPPSYVFQPIKEWNDFFKDSKIGRDAQTLLTGMDAKCSDCSRDAHFLWVESKGLTGENFTETLDKGVSETLLRKNSKPISLCGKCCVARIATDLERGNMTYLEVCSPKGTEDGFVVPMGY